MGPCLTGFISDAEHPGLLGERTVGFSSLGSHWAQQNFRARMPAAESCCCALKASRDLPCCHSSFLPVISKSAFIVTCFDWEPLEILNNVLLIKSSKIPLLTEYWEERVGRRTDGNLRSVAPHDLILWPSVSEKEKRLIHKQPETKILLVSFYCTSGNQPIMFRTLGDWKGVCCCCF